MFTNDAVTFTLTARVWPGHARRKPDLATVGTGGFATDGDSSAVAGHAISALRSALKPVKVLPASMQNGLIGSRLGVNKPPYIQRFMLMVKRAAPCDG